MVEVDDTSSIASSTSIIFDSGRRAFVFAIDYGQHMHQNGGARFRMAIQALREVLNDLCCSGPNDQVAVVFINTSKTNQMAQNIDNIFVHRELKLLDSEYIEYLDTLLQKNDIKSELMKDCDLGESNVCDLSELLYLSLYLFTHSIRLTNQRFLKIFSSQDSESVDDPQELLKIETKIGDLQKNKTKINVFLVSGHNEVFPARATTIWKYFDPDLRFYSDVDEFRTNIKRKNYTLRTANALPFKLSDGIELAVALYYLIKPIKIPFILLDSETNERVEHRTHIVPTNTESLPAEDNSLFSCDTAGNSSGPVGDMLKTQATNIQYTEVKHVLRIGGEKLVLGRGEMETLRRFDKAGIILVGFKPLSLLKPSHRMGPSCFIYPLDSAIKGSSTLYLTLLKRCLERNIFILARYNQRISTYPQMIALIPQGRDKNDPLSDYLYHGFHLVRLPFSDESRNMYSRMKPPSEEKWDEANQEMVNAARGFIQKLINSDFKPDDFANPVIQRHYKAMEVLALGLDEDVFQDEVEKFNTIRPYFEDTKYENLADEEVKAFEEACAPFESNGRRNDDDSPEEEGTNGKKNGKSKPKRPKRMVKIKEINLESMFS